MGIWTCVLTWRYRFPIHWDIFAILLTVMWYYLSSFLTFTKVPNLWMIKWKMISMLQASKLIRNTVHTPRFLTFRDKQKMGVVITIIPITVIGAVSTLLCLISEREGTHWDGDNRHPLSAFIGTTRRAIFIWPLKNNKKWLTLLL